MEPSSYYRGIGVGITFGYLIWHKFTLLNIGLGFLYGITAGVSIFVLDKLLTKLYNKIRKRGIMVRIESIAKQRIKHEG